MQSINKLKGEVRMKTEKSKLDAELQANTSLLDDIAKRQADLAKIAIERWYDNELLNFNSNTNNQYIQTKQATYSPTIEGKLWKANNLNGEIFYFFKSGQLLYNELIYVEGEKTYKGTWENIIASKQIKVIILNFTESYTIEDLSENSVKLKTITNDIIELVKV